jgi:hypothetical protein
MVCNTPVKVLPPTVREDGSGMSCALPHSLTTDAYRTVSPLTIEPARICIGAAANRGVLTKEADTQRSVKIGWLARLAEAGTCSAGSLWSQTRPALMLRLSVEGDEPGTLPLPQVISGRHLMHIEQDSVQPLQYREHPN